MKQVLTLLVAALLTLTAGATNYQDSLYVDVYGSTVADTATVSIDQATDGTYTVSLRNFKFSGLGVGNIVVDGVASTPAKDGSIALAADKTIQISAGDDPTMTSWIGPMLGDVPVVLSGKMTDDRLYLKIDINMNFMGAALTVGVTFGHNGTVTSIRPVTVNGQTATGIYDLNGRRVNSMRHGQVYILRQSDGRTVKVAR